MSDSTPTLERAKELLAKAHEPRRYLVAVDIRSGNIGGQGVRWVEIETALSAIRAALDASGNDERMKRDFTAGFDAACKHYLLPTGPNNRGILTYELDAHQAAIARTQEQSDG